MMFNIVGNKKWFFLISGVFIMIALVSLALFRLKPGIEFSSGSILTIRFEQQVEQGELQTALSDLGYPNAIIQRTAGGDFIIRTHELSGEVKSNLEEILTTRFGNLSEVEFNSVSPIIATETTRNAAIAVAFAAIGLLLYIAWAFRRMPSPFLYGVSAVIAIIHDIMITVGAFAILGRVLNWEINLMFVTGILALVGYSVNNTVVVFDRIRENLGRRISSDFAVVVNRSLLETMGRCFNSVITTEIAILALLLFVGASIRNFGFVLLIGLIAGTFSSAFLAPLLVVTWEKIKEARTA
ncbi:MAG: protein translocase subunit SecF [Chloroflexota bacterium]